MKYFNLKFLTFFLTALLAFGVGWGKTAGFSLASAESAPIAANATNLTTSITGTQEETWNVTIENTLKYSAIQGNQGSKYWQMGSGSNPIEMATFSTDGINGTITKIVVNCATGGGGGSVAVDVNNHKFADTQPMPSWSNNTGGNLTFNGSASGTISVKLIPANKKACYIQSITVTYEENTSTNPWIDVTPDPLNIDDDGGVFTVSCANMPDNGLGVSVDSSSPSNAFSFSKTNDNTFNEGDKYFPLTNHALENGTVHVNYTGHALSAAGVIKFESGSQRTTANVKYLYDGDIYIVGDVEGSGWSTEGGVVHGVPLVKNADGTYSVTVTATAGGEGFSWLYFTKSLNASNYYNLGYNRFGPVSNDANWSFTDALDGVYCKLDTVGNLHTIKMSPGQYTFTINPATNQFKITKVLGPVTYEKVTSTADVTDGNYLIIYETGATGLALDGSLETLDNTGNTQLVEITDNKITTSNAIYFTYDATAKTLKSASGFFIGHTGTKNTLDQSTTAGNGYYNTISFDSNGNALINVDETYQLRYNKTSGQERFRYYSGSNQELIQLYKEVNANKVATPKFSPAGDTYTEAQEVTISCATDGATIYYSTDGTNWTPGTTVNVTESCTLYAKATKDGMDDSNIATAVYTINLPEQVDNIAAVNALDPDKNFVFNNKAVVVHRKGHQMWIQDYNPTAGGALVYGEDLAFNDNDVLKANWTGTTATYNNKKEIINLVAETDGTKDAVAMKRTTLSESNINEYVLLENVALNIVDNDTIITLPDAKGNVKVYDNFKKLTDLTLTEGFNYNVKGIVDVYTKNNISTLEIYPLSIELVKKDLTLGFDPASVEIYVGETFTAPALTGVPEGETINVTYSSNNTELATVTDNVVSLVEGATGTATITANFAGNDYYNPASPTYTITVNEKLAHGMSFSAETLNVTYGDEEYTVPTLINPNSLDVTYSSNNENVAVVDESTGELILGDAGKAVITATTNGDASHNGGSVSYTVNIAKAAAGLTYGEPTPEFTVYVDQDFDAPTLTNPHKLTVTYESTDEDVALVDETGDVLIGEKVGDATITASVAESTNYLAGSASYIIHVIAKEDVTMSFNPTSVTLYLDQEFTQPTLTTNPANLAVKYSSNNEEVAMVDETSGEVLLMEKAGTATITAKYAGNDQYNANEASYTIKVENRPEILIETQNLDLGTDSEGEIFVMASDLKENVNVTSSNSNFTVEPATITPEQAANGVNVTVTYTGNNPEGESTTITFSTKDGEDVKVTVTAKAETYVDIAKPTFSPAAGTYTEPKEVAIACATPGVTIEYTINGVTKTYDGPFTVGNENGNSTVTVTATASKGSKVVYNDSQASATYVINAAPAAGIEDGYYSLQNNAEEVAGKYANVAGRRTLNFVADPDDKAGTIFRIKTDPDTVGQIEMLRSQGVDLQGYANRAMAYVPKAIELVLSKLANSSLGDPETPGDGILGENGLDLILEKFYKNFDYHLYIEQAEGGYRIYGKTPSMQHVVDFYHENTAQVEAKLPKLEGYINQVLDKIRNRIPAPYNANVVLPFSLKAVRDSIAKKNGITLIDPTEDEMGFYRQVLNNKEYVWDFAYQTAMMYVDAIKATQTYAQLPAEYKLYVEKMEKVRPDTKYYIIERGNELDYISENNVEIINNDPRTLWTITERETFKLSSAGELFGCPLATTGVGGYFTTNYTDFAYTLPEGVTAYKVTGVNEDGEAQLEALEGTIPAQTPVLLVAKEDGAYEVTLTTDAGTAVGINELKGPDYLITEYQIQTPIVVQLFSFAQGILGDNLYNTYVAPYEYLQLRYSGTVNNKYFWNVNSDLDELNGDCVVRSLAVKDGELAFSDHWTTENNKAFMVSEDYNAITLPGSLRGDVNHDGIVHISDVPALIDRLLEADFRACPYCSDVNEDNVVNIRDVTALIDILLGVDGSTTGTEEGGGE